MGHGIPCPSYLMPVWGRLHGAPRARPHARKCLLARAGRDFAHKNRALLGLAACQEARWAARLRRYASMKSWMSPSSTRSVWGLLRSVRSSLTNWYGYST